MAIPDNYYVGLSTSDPNTEVNEPSTNHGYSRQIISGFIVGQDGVAYNSEAISFNPCATADWGVITHFVIYDAETDGNLLMYGPLSSSKNVEIDDVVQIKSGSLKLSVINPE